ncbi:MAG: von Willebrand factor type A domain-containing protein [Myxococcales bacterium]|nr:von Willebrand factor type A domain-containing protein [Myxococcales bacterium]MBL0196815.1 von Willebrand factor type A domain-containing protein [Myxococcales bacterium]HQY63770.1 von Willebrand factor type A domain-containing protein [Polyangiaceae bacterium]
MSPSVSPRASTPSPRSPRRAHLGRAVLVLAPLALTSIACGGGMGGLASPEAASPRAQGPRHAAAEALPASDEVARPSLPSAPPPPPPVQASPAQIGVAKPAAEPTGTEHYADYGVNPVVDASRDRLSTFAIDVDTASYTISRRKLNEGTLPPFASVRAEEYVNYFQYAYAAPTARPFAVHTDAAPSPYTPGHHLVRVGLQGKRIGSEERTPVHLVYLVDTSGSMGGRDRIDLAKQSLHLMTDRLKSGDSVAICTYAGGVERVLEPTGVEGRERIHSAIDRLRAGGSTAMGDGLQLAYELARKGLVKNHVNRVVVLSDGDANVGRATQAELRGIIRGYRGQGITLSTVGFGSGNYKDATMEQLADSGDGNYAYIDSQEQARRVFVDQLDGMLQVIARDVKIQVEFDPSVVATYRLMGYENRDIADKDFRNDKVDAGEVGAGHTVTAMYDVVLKRTDASPVTVRVRHKTPHGSERAEESVFPMSPAAIAPTFQAAAPDFRFATAVVGFAEVLRKSPAAREWRLDQIAQVASNASFGRPERVELVGLVHRAASLSGQQRSAPVAIAK